MAEINITGTNNLDVQPESEQIYVGNNPPAQMEGTEIPSTDNYDNISIPGELFGEQSTQESDTEQAVTTESKAPAEPIETNKPNQLFRLHRSQPFLY